MCHRHYSGTNLPVPAHRAICWPGIPSLFPLKQYYSYVGKVPDRVWYMNTKTVHSAGVGAKQEVWNRNGKNCGNQSHHSPGALD